MTEFLNKSMIGLFPGHESADLKQNQWDSGSEEDELELTAAAQHALRVFELYMCVRPMYIHEYRGKSAFEILHCIT